MIYTYHVKAYAPEPRGGDNFFTCDGTVDRDEPLSGESEHVFAETSVRVSPNRFVLQQTELVGTQVGKFPSQIQKPK